MFSLLLSDITENLYTYTLLDMWLASWKSTTYSIRASLFFLIEELGFISNSVYFNMHNKIFLFLFFFSRKGTKTERKL